MTTSSEKPMSNMEERAMPGRRRRDRRARRRGRRTSGLRLRLLLRLAVDRAAGDLLRRGLGRARRGVGLLVGALHPFLEALDRAAEILPDVAQLLRAEDEHDDQQDDQPMPDAQRAHL